MGCIFDHLYNISLISPDSLAATRQNRTDPETIAADREPAADQLTSCPGVSLGLEDDGLTLLHWLTLHVSRHDKSASCGALSVFCALCNCLCSLCQESALSWCVCFLSRCLSRWRLSIFMDREMRESRELDLSSRVCSSLISSHKPFNNTPLKSFAISPGLGCENPERHGVI